MTHESRKGLRLIINLIHIGTQALLIWYVTQHIDLQKAISIEERLGVQCSLFSHLALMCGIFFIYYTLTKVFSQRYSTYSDGR
ncbi:MAG: hypothetical protein FJY65_09560 [Calditrichaeota bacterium]|nr:hypothetical protein [Calditrichota bacterium]